jgi:prepilin-type N-terminal cleavage/methylation domain-containing protein
MNNKGMSLLEILVVVSVFSILGILITRSILLTLGGGKKSESLIKIRENLNYSIAVMERQLRNADSIVDCSNSDTVSITYLDQNGIASSFSCVAGSGGLAGYVASGSAKLSSDTVNITNCSFVCASSSGTPSSVTINLEGTDASTRGIENTIVTAKTQIFLRNY